MMDSFFLFFPNVINDAYRIDLFFYWPVVHSVHFSPFIDGYMNSWHSNPYYLFESSTKAHLIKKATFIPASTYLSIINTRWMYHSVASVFLCDINGFVSHIIYRKNTFYRIIITTTCKTNYFSST